jgi:hypothetical protein
MKIPRGARIAATGTAYAGRCRLTALTLRSGTTASKVTVRDGGAGGTIVWELSLILTAAAGDQSHSISFPDGLLCATDMHVTVSGTGAEAYVGIGEY